MGLNPVLDERQTALATRCLWSLQESNLAIDGLLLLHVRGTTLTSTMQHNESTQRLAAVATAMFLLGEHTSEAWGNGESIEIQVRVQFDNSPNSIATMRNVTMKPVGPWAVLLAVHRNLIEQVTLDENLNQAARFLQAVLDNQPLPPLIWNTD
jgi:predicted regulator of Ras-like GTPase activity (Roadblock/LC7/MglB family)